MTANPSLIDAMARAIRPEIFEHFDRYPDDADWRNLADQARSQARAALQALLEAGPTEAMIDAGLKVTCGGLDDEANRYWQAEEYKAMLSAALEEPGNV
jgi:L-lactate utilization protein LutB